VRWSPGGPSARRRTAWSLGTSSTCRPPETLASVLRTPDFGQVFDPGIWQTAFTIAVVASIETLLCIEAIDKLDPMKRSTPTNRELMAQGAGNIVAGLLGGLPMTAVIVRGSANIQSGGRTRMSAFAHGVLLVLALLFLGSLINSIPLAALAAVLLHVGYKLAPVQLFRFMFRQPVEQWAPFMVTIVAVLFSDLLLGVAIGMVVAVFFILRANLQTPYFLHDRDIHEVHGIPYVHLELSENVSFLNRASVSKVLHDLNGPQVVHIDGRGSQYIHPDVVELIHEFADTAHLRDIQVELEDIPALGTSVPAH
jgi:MFS superfamily sulfate permease-like transporter